LGGADDQVELGGFDVLQASGLGRWIGRLPARTAMLALAAGTLLGIIFTLMADQEPGTLLGVFIIVGSIAAALVIKRGRIYLLFPAPALAFFVGAIVAGKVHDAKLGSSTAGLASGFTQWIAGIFFPAVIATILVLLIGGGRWVLGRQLVTTGQSPLPGGGRPAPGNARPAPSGDRPAIDDWAEDDPFEDRALHTQMIPAAKPNGPGPVGTPRPARPAREGNQGADRDPWGDPRLPADRSQPTGPRPGQGSGPPPSQGSGPRPNQGSGPRPNQGTGARPSQGSGPRPNQGTGARPNQGTGARPSQGSGARPNQGTGARPNQGTGARPRPAARPAPEFPPQPRDPDPRSQPQPGWSPNQRPRRPVRPQPPDNWTQR
jgi:hypothetical protein